MRKILLMFFIYSVFCNNITSYASPFDLVGKFSSAKFFYKYYDDEETGNETVYFSNNRVCIYRLTYERLEIYEEKEGETPVFHGISTKRTETRNILDKNYIWTVDDLAKKAFRIPNPISLQIKFENEQSFNKEKDFVHQQINYLFQKFPTEVKKIKNAKNITYFGKPCKTYSIFGATYILWDQMILRREITLPQIDYKELLEIRDINLNASVSEDVFQIPDGYEIKDITPDEAKSLFMKQGISPELK